MPAAIEFLNEGGMYKPILAISNVNPKHGLSTDFYDVLDFEEFLRIPIQYFEAVTQEREENSDNERLLEPPMYVTPSHALIGCGSSQLSVLESMAHVTPTDTRVRVPTHMFCEVRILETSEGGWRRTRRLVFTSSPKEQPPQCKSYCTSSQLNSISSADESDSSSVGPCLRDA